MKIKYYYFLFLIMLCNSVLAQSNFFINNSANRYTMSFKMVHNLMVIPVEVNGKKLSFLLDTGVSNTVILNIKAKDSLKLKNTKKIKIQGLGDGEIVDAYISTNNQIKIGDHINSRNHKIYLILGKGFNLSNRMGEDIQGIIGGDLFKDFIVKVNYNSKKITFYKPDKYKYKKCNKCDVLPLSFLFNKPYVFANTKLSDSVSISTKLLIDSGGSDALWLFENSKKGLKAPNKFFRDYLGQGLNGNIYGKRSRIKGLSIGKFELKNMTVSFPDTLSLSKSMRHVTRQGTIGAEALKRFHLIIDYPNKKLTLKKNTNYFYDDFNYNMSGIEVAYNGKMIVQEKKFQDYSKTTSDFISRNEKGNAIEFVYDYVFSLRPSIQITDIRKNSPADIAGLLVGDVILEINGRPVYNHKLQDIVQKFYEKDGEEVKLLIDRNGARLDYNFKLKKIL